MSRGALTVALAALVREHGLDAVLREIAAAYEGAADVHEVVDLVTPRVTALRLAVNRMGDVVDPADVMNVHADITGDAEVKS